MRKVYFFTLLVVVWAPVAAEVKQGPAGRLGTRYSNPSLGFGYTQPDGMMDKTERFREDIEEQAKALHATNKLSVLLALSSGADDTAGSWSSVTIETYPRGAVADADDASAEAIMSAWVAGSQDSHALPRSVVISGQRFAVSVFGMQDDLTRKGAVVWTTVRKGQLLSFAFVANSPDRLKVLAESMKTLQFF